MIDHAGEFHWASDYKFGIKTGRDYCMRLSDERIAQTECPFCEMLSFNDLHDKSFKWLYTLHRLVTIGFCNFNWLTKNNYPLTCGLLIAMKFY